MKKNITKILFPSLIVLAFIGFSHVTNASTVPSVYVTPTGITKNVHEVFSVSVNVSASDSKVYAVEGTINFKNLNCESITVADGLMPQTTPTCAKPYFLIGIPSGTVKDTVLATITLKGNAVGEATVSIANVDIIGEGKSVSTNSTIGSYIIKTGPTGGYFDDKSIQDTSNGFLIKKPAGQIINKKAGKLLPVNDSLTNSTDSNNQLAYVGKTLPDISIIWILIAIILMLLIYIYYRERYYQKNSK